MSNEMLRAKKKLIAVRRAERRLMTRLGDIDWEFDYLLPEVAAMELAAAERAELPEFIVEDENKNTK